MRHVGSSVPAPLTMACTVAAFNDHDPRAFAHLIGLGL